MARWNREPWSGFSHGVTALAGVVGTVVLLVIAAGSPWRQAAVGAYGVSLVLLFLASAAYHLYQGTERGTMWLHRLDHGAIFLLIAGTYTPIAAVVLDGTLRIAVLALVWTLTAVGVTLKLSMGPGPRKLAVIPYLVMGWLALPLVWKLALTLPAAALAWLVAGGVVYSVGAVVYALKRPDPLPGRFGFHELWHLFVIGGAALHYVLIAGYVAPYAA
ncbi:MAG: hemolysin III family protein [Deltaproteobacteria bacterium]|nr:hemolysin III family protein [Deltaproteobacteria bacterium]